MRRLLNFDKAQFEGEGKYNIPAISPVKELLKGEFIPMNYGLSTKSPSGKILHSFVHDYQFERLWNNPDRYLPMLRSFDAVCSPDFSIYTDMPLALQIFNHYRKHWLGAYWQQHGIKVYPTISWSTPESFEWCFDGEPRRGIVIVSSVGTQVNRESKRLFLTGYEEMVKRLDPAGVIFYGKVPAECGDSHIVIKPYYENIRDRGGKDNGRT